MQTNIEETVNRKQMHSHTESSSLADNKRTTKTPAQLKEEQVNALNDPKFLIANTAKLFQNSRFLQNVSYNSMNLKHEIDNNLAILMPSFHAGRKDNNESSNLIENFEQRSLETKNLAKMKELVEDDINTISDHNFKYLSSEKIMKSSPNKNKISKTNEKTPPRFSLKRSTSKNQVEIIT